MSDAYKIFRQIQEKDKKAKRHVSYEKEDLIDEIIELQESEEQLKYRIDKAIEYIKNENLRIVDISKEIPELCVGELLEILKGKSE